MIPFLLVLAIGESLAMSQSVTTAVLLGMNRLMDLLRLSLAEIGTAALLGILLSQRLGVLGLCLGVAAASLLVRGIGQFAIGCSALGLPLLTTAGRSLLPALLCAVPATLATGWMVRAGRCRLVAGVHRRRQPLCAALCRPFLAQLKMRA